MKHFQKTEVQGPAIKSSHYISYITHHTSVHTWFVTGVLQGCPRDANWMLKEFLQECYRGVTMGLQGCKRMVYSCYRCVTGALQSVTRVLQVFQAFYKCIIKVIEECYKSVTGVLQGFYIVFGVIGVLHGCYRCVKMGCYRGVTGQCVINIQIYLKIQIFLDKYICL